MEQGNHPTSNTVNWRHIDNLTADWHHQVVDIVNELQPEPSEDENEPENALWQEFHRENKFVVSTNFTGKFKLI